MDDRGCRAGSGTPRPPVSQARRRDQHVIVLRRQQACTCIGLLVVIRLLPVIFYSERLNCRRT
jgi:hypothetical protein